MELTLTRVLLIGGAGGDFGGIDFSKLGGGAMPDMGALGGMGGEEEDDDEGDEDMPPLEGEEEESKAEEKKAESS